ncbi:MAG: hypothetical protein RL642_1551 [Bacteroidota bacterium]|jgi:hypothetical protein
MKKGYSIEEIMNSLDGIERAEPAPFLFTRVHARYLKNENSQALTLFRFIAKPSFVMAVAFLIILINGYIMYNRNAFQQQQDEMGQTIAAEYGRQNAINPYELNEAP